MIHFRAKNCNVHLIFYEKSHVETGLTEWGCGIKLADPVKALAMTSSEQWHTYSLIMSIESCLLLLSSLNRCFHSSNVGDLSDPERFSSPPAHMLVASIFFPSSDNFTPTPSFLDANTFNKELIIRAFILYTILCSVISFFVVVSEGTAKFIRHRCWYCTNDFLQEEEFSLITLTKYISIILNNPQKSIASRL